ncbi:hypothetical protein NDU88_011585 [Pleurodeles waltl]|uniref:Uncharacterized protein n=1 Tax=Pleurodeles waltl TaxID=8319 RepID=A0AAV7R3S8_PLEWA|nr:hypothetical protein NDU88_011585 [Pleurodeles waltl]
MATAIPPASPQSPTGSLATAVNTAMERLAVRGTWGAPGVPCTAHALGMGSAGAPRHSSIAHFTARISDSEMCDGYYCTRCTSALLPALLRASSNEDVTFPLGQWTVTLLPSAGPAEKS